MTTEPKKESPLDRLKKLVADKKKAEKQNVLDKRYPEMEQYAETETERDKRIMDTPSAWNKL